MRLSSLLCCCGIVLLLAFSGGCTQVQTTPPNREPTIEITSGPGGASYGLGLMFDVEAAVTDEEDEPAELLVIASSGGLSLGEYTPDDAGSVTLTVSTENLGPGSHTLTLMVVDTEAAAATATDEFSVVKYYNAEGEVLRVERDSSGDGSIDTWEYFEEGQVIRVGRDNDGDGAPEVMEQAP